MEKINAVQDFKNFLVDGINEEISKDEEVKIKDIQDELAKIELRLNFLEEEKKKLTITPTISFYNKKFNKNLVRKMLAVDVDYTIEQQCKIFNHGRTGYNIWFLNQEGKLCVLEKTYMVINHGLPKLVCKVVIGVKELRQKSTVMTLDNFLYLVEKGTYRITNNRFNRFYMRPYLESNYIKHRAIAVNNAINNELKKLDDIKNSDFYVKLTNKYNEKEKELEVPYLKEFENKVRAVIPDPAKQLKKKKKINKVQTELKSIWNSYISDSEKAYFLGWLCKHLTRMTIKVVDGGVSDKVISKTYPDDIYGSKYKEKANSSGWDASSGKLSFDDITNAPIFIINRLSTVKHKQHCKTVSKDMFNGNTLSNLDLCLFLLSKYAKYGVKSGVKHLNKVIDYKELRDNEVAEYTDIFDSAYNTL